MQINKRQLKETSFKFSSVSSRLLNTRFEDYMVNLEKFLAFINENEVIKAFVDDCVSDNVITLEDLKDDADKVSQSMNDEYLFKLGDSDEREVADIYQNLRFLEENDYDIPHSVAIGYANSLKYQDNVDEFNARYVNVLVNHISNYLVGLGIQMGIDEQKIFNVTVSGGAPQINIAADNAQINAELNSSVDWSALESIIDKARESSAMLPARDAEAADDALEMVDGMAKNKKLDAVTWRTAKRVLQGIEGSVEFASAVAGLISFFSPLLG